jgi:hypothetical protein
MKKKLLLLRASVLSAFLAISGLGLSQTYTFTTGTATGNVGPTQGMIDAAYLGTTLDGDVTVVGGIQYWTVPVTGPYEIQAFGGQGYGPFGGRGAHIKGEFTLTAGTVLKILVGQQGGHYLNYPATTYNHQFGGGGGSFVTDNSNTPYVVAGGGGGNHGTSFLPQCDGQITEAGAGGLNGSTLGAGGTNGQGGLQASSADGGGGLLTDGTGLAGGKAFVNGGLGGIDEGTGGFGCGGGTSSWNNYRGGGGGGYSGGGGANNGGSCCPAGGGGGSYNNGANPVNLAGVQLGDGQVIISYMCVPTSGSLAPDLAILPDTTHACIVDSIPAPTASNNCTGGLVGTPDITSPITTIGTTVVTWTYTDGTNTITQTQNVIITGNDVDPPVLDNASLSTLTGQCELASASAPTATDYCAGSINGVPDVTFPITTQGTTTITWTFNDGSGNIVTQTQTVIIDDTDDPVFDNPVLNNLDGCKSLTPTPPTATDACSGTIVGVPDVSFPITTAGLTTINWAYDDGNGNISTQPQNVYLSAPNNTTTLSGSTLTSNGSGVTYQWMDCTSNQLIPGATNQTFTPIGTGYYAVIVTESNCSDTSDCKLVAYAGLEEFNNNLVQIYPNPSQNGIFKVEVNGKIDDIILFDALGRKVVLPIDTATGIINGSKLSAGKYIVKVISSDLVFTKGLVVLE